MRSKTFAITATALFLILAGCSSVEDTPTPTSPTRPTTATAPPDADALAVGFSVNEAPTEEWTEAFAIARSSGMTTTDLTIYWDDFERNPGEFGADPNWLEIANTFYPGEHLPISLTVSVIDTTAIRLPQDLENRRLDDPEVIERFNAFLTWVSAGLTDVQLTTVSIGNEVDIFLGDTGRWDEFAVFLAATGSHARTLFPGIPVSTKVTVDGLLDNHPDRVSDLLADTDAYLLTYYHLGDSGVRPAPDIAAVLGGLASDLEDKPIYMAELGYPSSELLGSSEQSQEEFVRVAMETLTAHRDRFHGVQWVWLTDITDDAVAQYAEYYEWDDPQFLAYLGSIGLRRQDGTPKPALETLRRMATTP